LVEQIEGKVNLLREEGTHFIIHFKEPDYKKRI
jgi:two-component sensor histidine kinase